MLLRSFVLTAALVGLGSCATLDKGQCLSGDWASIGFADGEAGYTQDRLQQHTEACAKHGVTPDPRAYFTARDQGLRQYCTPQRGFAVARNGQAYGNVCPPSLESGFLGGYGDGQLVHGVVQRLDKARSDKAQAQSRIRDIDRDIKAEEAKIADPKVSDKDKDAARGRIRRLRDDRERAEDSIPRYERVEREEARELDRLRASFTRTYGPF